jgi:hypothetical protein
VTAHHPLGDRCPYDERVEAGMGSSVETEHRGRDEVAASPDRGGGRGPRAAAVTLGGMAALAGIGWLGLRIEPQPFPDAGLEAGPVETLPLPVGLPAPVERFYQVLYGDEVPVIATAVVSGRGWMRVNGITFAARFRFSHVAGHGYRHYIEVTGFGRRLLAVNEWFLDGSARLELPFGVMQGPKVDQGANLALWAEAGWFPAIWLTDHRVRWEPVGADSARLLVPFGDGSEELTVTFDRATGLLQRMESMRFKGEEAATRTGWSNEALDWAELDGLTVPMTTTVTWEDESTPWARLRTEALLLNADLDRYVTARGP